MDDFFDHKRVLVTGGTGSIGKEIAAQLLKHNVQAVRVLSNDENSLFNMRMDYQDDRLRFLLGDVRDYERMKMASREIDIVYHTAALKHVPIGEYNPFELVQTNVVGTQNVVSAALEEGVDRFLLISSDKAVNPTSTLGASKLLCEKLVVSAAAYRGYRKTRFASMRFGNVLDSRGSVLEIFRRQMERLEPLTVTDPHMTRFAFAASQAVDFILRATAMTQGGEIFIPKMQALHVIDLAQAMIEALSPVLDLDPKQLGIQTTKVRPGEKIHEELMTSAEAQRAVELEDMYVVLPETLETGGYEGKHPPAVSEYSSGTATPMSKSQIVDLLQRINALSTKGRQ